ncbi:Asp/Glu racemase [Sedimentitalea sp. JM2-8]|uniref:Asp/Glu racemase n=1 Tax=Sedimentitalea xiamensis TaxID=3050037 RepID=A0ABT7FBX1_9RHOB|nr:aspartate/glutamate racemase family protein [Sedimentitalea xiamensis]MDK3072612.1 Asp/Glu racemase [Sedimentitalea xiamensis]
MRIAYELKNDTRPNIGLIVLQADHRIEQDFRRLIPLSSNLHVSRVPSGAEVTPETLSRMENDLPRAAALLPPSVPFDAIGYACTSGAAQIGPARVADLVRSQARVKAVSDPVSALIAACAALGLKRLGLLSPYVESVSERLRQVLAGQGISTPVFGSFDQADEATVARISATSLLNGVNRLARKGGIDGVFLSCTNLDTLDIIATLETETGLPVLSSNLVLAWHLNRLSGGRHFPRQPGRLLAGRPETS